MAAEHRRVLFGNGIRFVSHTGDSRQQDSVELTLFDGPERRRRQYEAAISSIRAELEAIDGSEGLDVFRQKLGQHCEGFAGKDGAIGEQTVADGGLQSA